MFCDIESGNHFESDFPVITKITDAPLFKNTAADFP